MNAVKTKPIIVNSEGIVYIVSEEGSTWYIEMKKKTKYIHK